MGTIIANQWIVRHPYAVSLTVIWSIASCTGQLVEPSPGDHDVINTTGSLGGKTETINQDSPARCGDTICGGIETCNNCEEDCGVCQVMMQPSTCNDGVCDDAETCGNCESDCGACDEPLWFADADTLGLSVWEAEEEGAPDGLSLVSDPSSMFGQVYQAKLQKGVYNGGKYRSEFRGAEDSNGNKIAGTATTGSFDGSERGYNDLYFGFRSFVSQGTYFRASSSNSGNILQFKGDSSCGGPVVGLTVKDDHLTLRTELDNAYDSGNRIWQGPLIEDYKGAWHEFVIHVHFSKNENEGMVEIWYDGIKQTMINGDQSINVATMCPDDQYVRLKMGLYSLDLDDAQAGTEAYHWIESPRIGQSFSAVVPR
ncbi:MAG: heparin lyase I family protein [Myxococcales bacterium]|nr:MAG: heparin lyase I family protein [Myxococcales bacterium]